MSYEGGTISEYFENQYHYGVPRRVQAHEWQVLEGLRPVQRICKSINICLLQRVREGPTLWIHRPQLRMTTSTLDTVLVIAHRRDNHTIHTALQPDQEREQHHRCGILSFVVIRRMRETQIQVCEERA